MTTGSPSPSPPYPPVAQGATAIPPVADVVTQPKPAPWQERHGKTCRYKRDERWGLDLDGCCRCRYLDRVRGLRPGTKETR